MKINISMPQNGTTKQFDVAEDSIKKGVLNDIRVGQDVDGGLFGPQFEGYVFRLKGGSDKQGFPMVPGVLANARVSLLLPRGRLGFNAWRGRSGERRRKSVRGAIIGGDIAVVNVVVLKSGKKPIEGVTDVSLPRRLGPKRASKIRKLFNLSRSDDVRRYVVKRKVDAKGGKTRFKAPKVQRLLSPAAKARRAKKLNVAREKLKKNRQQRREWLAAITRERMAHRQRRVATTLRKAKAEVKTFAKHTTAAVAPATKKIAKK